MISIWQPLNLVMGPNLNCKSLHVRVCPHTLLYQHYKGQAQLILSCLLELDLHSVLPRLSHYIDCSIMSSNEMYLLRKEIVKHNK